MTTYFSVKHSNFKDIVRPKFMQNVRIISIPKSKNFTILPLQNFHIHENYKNLINLAKFENPGGYSSMIWVGTWDLKSRPIFIPNFAKKWDQFIREPQILLKISDYFPKLLGFQANFGIRLLKLGPFSHQFQKILKIWPMFIPVFALNKASSLYQEADFETHFSSTSPDRPLY